MTPEGRLVTVYWRPGCPYCNRLRRGLRRAGLTVYEVDIWSNPEAAAKVRALAGGNETVPTVVVGDRALVGPTVNQVLGTLGAVAPQLMPAGRSSLRARARAALRAAMHLERRPSSARQ